MYIYIVGTHELNIPTKTICCEYFGIILDTSFIVIFVEVRSSQYNSNFEKQIAWFVPSWFPMQSFLCDWINCKIRGFCSFPSWACWNALLNSTAAKLIAKIVISPWRLIGCLTAPQFSKQLEYSRPISCAPDLWWDIYFIQTDKDM